MQNPNDPQDQNQQDRSNREVLETLEDADIRQLIIVYEDNPNNPFTSSVLTNGLRIKQLLPSYPIKFYSPLGMFRENGTFFAFVQFDTCLEIGVFSQFNVAADLINDTVYTGLIFSKKINYYNPRRPIVFKHFNPNLRKVINRIIKLKSMKVETEEHLHIYKIDKALASKFEVNIPNELEVKSLNSDQAMFIKGKWPRTSSLDIIRTEIDTNGGYGLYVKSNNQLISWGVKTMTGQIGYVQTNKPSLRKGFASIIIKVLAKELASEEIHPTAVVTLHDDKSHNLLENLGFENVGTVQSLYLKPTDPYQAAAAEDQGYEVQHPGGIVRQPGVTRRRSPVFRSYSPGTGRRSSRSPGTSRRSSESRSSPVPGGLPSEAAGSSSGPSGSSPGTSKDN